MDSSWRSGQQFSARSTSFAPGRSYASTRVSIGERSVRIDVANYGGRPTTLTKIDIHHFEDRATRTSHFVHPTLPFELQPGGVGAPERLWTGKRWRPCISTSTFTTRTAPSRCGNAFGLGPRRQVRSRAPHDPHRDYAGRLRRHRQDAAARVGGLRPAVDEGDLRYVWLEARWLDRLKSYRRPGESYSDVIIRLAVDSSATPTKFVAEPQAAACCPSPFQPAGTRRSPAP